MLGKQAMYDRPWGVISALHSKIIALGHWEVFNLTSNQVIHDVLIKLAHPIHSEVINAVWSY